MKCVICKIRPLFSRNECSTRMCAGCLKARAGIDLVKLGCIPLKALKTLIFAASYGRLSKLLPDETPVPDDAPITARDSTTGGFAPIGGSTSVISA